MRRKFNNPCVRPGQKVYVEYDGYQAKKIYTVAWYERGRIVIEVPLNNKDGKIKGWSAWSKPDVARAFNLNISKYFWFIWHWKIVSNKMEI